MKAFENFVGEGGNSGNHHCYRFLHCSQPFQRQILIIIPHKTLFKTSPRFTCLQYKSFENTVGKREIARNEQFLLFPQCFLPIWRT